MFIKRKEVAPLAFDGLSIVDYTAGRQVSSSLAEITVPAGAKHKVSWSRRSDKYYYVVSGRVLFSVGEQSQDLVAGDACVIRKRERFSYKNRGATDAVLILLHTPSFDLECEEFE